MNLRTKNIKHVYVKTICQPFYDYYKKEIKEFPYRDESKVLIHHDGMLINQKDVRILEE